MAGVSLHCTDCGHVTRYLWVMYDPFTMAGVFFFCGIFIASGLLQLSKLWHRLVCKAICLSFVKGECFLYLTVSLNPYFI